ncbi:L,D-transpeptidase family protein [Pusillimonas sp. TS35]|nr:L,D-transpeptidase family protein [Pusillimonas sp. TS35]
MRSNWKSACRNVLCGAALALCTLSAGAQAPAAPSGAQRPSVAAPQIIPGINISNPDLLEGELLRELPIPSWFENGRPGSDAQLALKTLADAESQGLNPRDYHAAELAQAFQQAEQRPADAAATARLDNALNEALVHYLRDLRQGRLSPNALQHRFNAPPLSTFDARGLVANARQANRLRQALDDAAPKVPMYESLRTAMNAYRAMAPAPAWQTALPPLPGRSLKPGNAYSGLPTLAARLAALGDLPASTSVPALYEGALVDAVRRFQERHGLDSDGVIGATTLAQLNVTPAQRVTQMALTLERLRWTPLLHGPRMVVVNIPEFVLRAYETQGSKVKLDLEMRVIVGSALDTRTPIFLHDMRFIEFSPYWNVPPSIARGETLPKLRRNPAYFTQQGFEFVTRDGKVVNTLSSAAIEATQRGEWRIRQRPGPRNALGDIKFIFPNDQNIYLHHTPAPELFSKVRRDFSHGCIRIEQPVQLALFVLHNSPEWTVDRIEQAMQAGKSRTIKLDEPIPVLIAYSTAIVKNGGKVYFLPDIYQQDARLEQALRDVGRAR